MMQGKKTPTYDWSKSFTTIVNEKRIENPISLDVEQTMHSFTMCLRFKIAENGSIAGFMGNGFKYAINIDGHSISYQGISSSYPKHLKQWTHVVLSHSFANKKTMLFVNGERIGAIEEQLEPTKIYFGGNSPNTELKDLAVYRSSLNEDEALDLFNKKFIQSSLEFYNPLTTEIIGNELENRAQSLEKMKISKNVKMEYSKVELY